MAKEVQALGHAATAVILRRPVIIIELQRRIINLNWPQSINGGCSNQDFGFPFVDGYRISQEQLLHA